MPNKISVPLLSALKELFSWLKATHVPGMVIGGVAASLLGRPRVTQDIDVIIWIDFNKWKDFLEAGKKHGFSPRIKNLFEFARENRVFLLRHSPSGIDVDISLAALPFEEEAIRRAVEKRIKGIRVYLPTPEDLIIMKAVAHRPRDFGDIESILDAHPDLDLKRVRRWAREFAKSLEMPEILDDLEKITRHPKKRLT